jgi:hypothetical protein
LPVRGDALRFPRDLVEAAGFFRALEDLLELVDLERLLEAERP